MISAPFLFVQVADKLSDGTEAEAIPPTLHEAEPIRIFR
jgi:hypothetical protein